MDDRSDVKKDVESPVSFLYVKNVKEKCVENISNFYFHNDYWWLGK